jgi:hypothetical protein
MACDDFLRFPAFSARMQDIALHHARIAEFVLQPRRGGPKSARMSDRKTETTPPPAEPPKPAVPAPMPKEIGGPPGPEPTRYGDWQYKGRCTDF